MRYLKRNQWQSMAIDEVRDVDCLIYFELYSMDSAGNLEATRTEVLQ